MIYNRIDKNMTKKILLVWLLLFSSLMFAQNKKIVEILNKQLQTEYNKYYDEFDKAYFKLLEPYKIDDKGILSFKFSEFPNHYNGKTIVKRSVPLNKILKIDKDMNLVFFTEGEDVLEQIEVFDENNKLIEERINKKTIFQTYINKEKNNERLKKSLLKAFKKAGFEVTNEYWYD